MKSRCIDVHIVANLADTSPLASHGRLSQQRLRYAAYRRIRGISTLLDSSAPAAGVRIVAPESFRRIALSLPEAIESSHMGTPDFRVRDKIFATLGGGGVKDRALVKLSLPQQEMFLRIDAQAFAPVSGAWGRKGWTGLHLREAQDVLVRDALLAAWRNVVPKRLAARVESGD